mgnify:CR=1 FL=1|tara:strand:- start:11573 stop:12193 length:621 start_codon:yes stop_codon:yes gene_type:complete
MSRSKKEAGEAEADGIFAGLKTLRQAAKDSVNNRADELAALVANRQDVINPYANVTNTYADLTNQFANLGVATQAAEFQAEQADIALANTLDTIAATGAGAGGATALAQAALQSKRGISASLEKQEAANQKAAARGAANVDQLKAQGERSMQMAKAQGERFAFQITENREQQEIDRQSNLLDQERQALENAMNAQNEADIYESQQY